MKNNAKNNVIKTILGATNRIISWVRLTILLVLMALIWLLTQSTFLTPLTQWTLSATLGEPVNIERVALSADPFGLRIQGLSLPESGITVHQSILDINTLALAQGKWVVQQWSVDNIRYTEPPPPVTSTAQGATGQSTPTQPSVATEEDFSLPDVQLPSFDELVAQENLKTTQALDQLKALNQQADQSFASITQTDWHRKEKTYTQKWQDIKSAPLTSKADLDALRQKIQALQTQIKQDKTLLDQQWQTAKHTYADYERGVDDLLQAPEQDMDYLSDKYTLNGDGFKHLAQSLFGQQIVTYTNLLEEWIAKLKPFVEPLLASDNANEEASEPSVFQGQNIVFPEKRIYPDFLIETVRADYQSDHYQLSFNGNDWTHQQHVTQKRSTFDLVSGTQSKPMTGTGYVDLMGEKPLQWAEFDFPATTANETLSNKTSYELFLTSLRQTHTTFKGHMSLNSTEFELNARQNYTQTQFTSGTQVDETFNELLVKPLSKADDFYVQMSAKGQLTDPKFSFRSDLDRIIQAGINARLAELTQEWREKIQATLTQKRQALEANIHEQKQRYAKELAEFDKAKSDWQTLQDSATPAALQNQYDQEVARVKAEAQAKLDAERQAAQAKLDAEKQRLAEEKRQAEAKARQAAEAEKKAAEERLRREAENKLKNLF